MESTQDKVTQQLGEELVHKFWAEEEERERQSRPKKPKKKDSSHRRETSAGRDSSKEEERHKKRKKKEKEAKAWDAQEAQLWAEREEKEKEEDKRLAQEKLINQLWKEKYSHECPTSYWKKHITMEQRESINLDDHTTYLTDIWQDKSQYPYQNVMSCCQLIDLLEEHGQKEKANKVRTVIDKGLNSYAPTGKLSPSAPVIKPKFFI